MISDGHGLFLDLDGTLADSLPAMRTAFNCFMHAYGIKASDSEFQCFNGPPLGQIVANLKAKYGLSHSCAALINEYDEFINRVYKEIVPMPGARKLLCCARANGWSIGIVTSNTRVRATRWLESVDFYKLIDVIIGDEDIANGKPSREPYLVAVLKGQCQSNMSIAVDDSRDGVTSAVSAGLETYGYAPDKISRDWPENVKELTQLTDLMPRLANPSFGT